jgi:UDP-N-acetylmuramate dehydrogenase
MMMTLQHHLPYEPAKMGGTALIQPHHGELASPYSTYRIGGVMDEAYFPTTRQEAEALLNHLKPRLLANEPLTTIGWGSNTLIASAGIRGITLVLRKLAGWQQLSPTVFQFDAGVHLAKVANIAKEAGLTGAEFYIGIPGTIGGACRMNAGAMGKESALVITKVLVYDLTTFTAAWVDKESLQFAYRFARIDSSHQLILTVECLFQPATDPALTQRLMDDNMTFRKTHHPIEPNGGSVFRNPPNAPPVGKLVDELGGKGIWQVGDAMVSPKHGNFIINKGNATSSDVLQLMLQIKHRVFDATGHVIFPENKFLGHAPQQELDWWAALRQGDPHYG